MAARLGVVVVEPKSDGNLGSIARIMANFGVSELEVVGSAPLTDFTRSMACHGWDVVENRVEHASLNEALQNFDLSVATTAQAGASDRHTVRSPTLAPEELAERLGEAGGRVALVLGREDSGLTADEIRQCDIVCSVPTTSDYGTLNVSHALAILLYALKPGAAQSYEMASGELLRTLHQHCDELIEKAGYDDDRARDIATVVKRAAGRAELTAQEAHTLNGFLRDVLRRMEPAGKNE